ncbi:HlyD family type I secretion periplasmic adaptor subunit [Fulvimarina sp. 2208YS6-2-32]|uniref:Membrane fusion protein (MFP) family protein n=1 Tax=Fulvimarina uroteuthidis TaxID=3098149 RepID=A0ABU5I4N3_9HYPH|nr:HlyD family type I secretion periplasmic adaptor subunit [Fulvimarina sp. 2208YS6-2-32]MDY8109749.1 HlyD family type I secretion periplasmic adaptor subunit [Fulvimarina sp. 2208YS6-2-32]
MTIAPGGDPGVETGLSDILGGVSVIILLCAGLFAVWGAAFPLSSAIIASGSLVSSGSNQLVQHPSGGTVVAILARDGDRVAEGEVIARLDPAPIKAELTRLKARRATLAAMKDRLEAGRRGRDAGTGQVANAPLRLTDAATPSLDDMLRLEQLRTRLQDRISLDASLEALDRQADATRAQRDGFERRIADLQSQIAIYQDQTDGVRRLVSAGHIARRELWTSENQLLDARSRLSALLAERAVAGERLGELSADGRRLRGENARDDAQQLTEIIGELGQIEDQIAAAERSFEQVSLRAPMTGILVNSALSTEGGVARGGETLAEIVPEDGRMIFQARLLPKDIDHVRVGQPAEIEVTAFNMRLTDRIGGTVVYVSADTSEDERTGEQFYFAKLAIDAGSTDAVLRAGMVGTAYIAGPTRSFFAYVLQPLLDGYRHAFREWQ